MGRMVSQREIEALLLEEGEMYWVDKNIKYPLPYSIEAGDAQGVENASEGSGYRGSLGKVRDPLPVQVSLYSTWHGPWVPHGNWIPILEKMNLNLLFQSSLPSRKWSGLILKDISCSL